MYRHPLIHGDRPRVAIYRKQEINWEWRIGNGHQIKRNILAIDIKKIYDDFLLFLVKEIRVAGSKKVWVEHKVVFKKSIKEELKSEFKKLRK